MSLGPAPPITPFCSLHLAFATSQVGFLGSFLAGSLGETRVGLGSFWTQAPTSTPHLSQSSGFLWHQTLFLTPPIPGLPPGPPLLKPTLSLQETLGGQPGWPAETGLCQREGPSSQPAGLKAHMGAHGAHGESVGQGDAVLGRELQVTAPPPSSPSLGPTS